MKAWEKFIRQEMDKGLKNILKRIEHKLYYGFDSHPFFIERKKLYYEITPMPENNNHIKLILTY